MSVKSAVGSFLKNLHMTLLKVHGRQAGVTSTDRCSYLFGSTFLLHADLLGVTSLVSAKWCYPHFDLLPIAICIRSVVSLCAGLKFA